MSFILDALKKSENERQRQAGPALASVPSSVGEGPNKAWLTLLVVTMAIAIGILAIMLVRTDVPPRTVTAEKPNARSIPATETMIPAAASEPTQSVEENIAQAPVEKVPQQREVRSLRDEVSPAPDATTEDTVPAGQQPSVRTVEPATSVPSRSSSTGSDGDASSLPTARDLQLQGVLTGPPMHLDLHIYSEDPARRAVFINGQKYREGDQIKNGPRVREIVPEGAVLDDGGQRFLLEPD
jgi:general secretion pathway protein B